MILEQEVTKYIDNLRGKKAYEEKKSKKLGFETFEKYIEHKILKKLQLKDAEKPKVNILNQNKNNKKEKNATESSCSCCSN